MRSTTILRNPVLKSLGLMVMTSVIATCALASETVLSIRGLD